MGQIILLDGQQEKSSLSVAINRTVKEQRGKSRPFVLILVEDSGDATVATNLTNRHERQALLEQVAQRLKGN